MANVRLIARLDLKMNFLIKGVQLEGWRKVGDPSEFARLENDVARHARIAFRQASHDGSMTLVRRLPRVVTKQFAIPFPAEHHRFEQYRLSNAEAHVYA